ncbi:MAG: hypothetical protein N2663_03555 [Chlorobi bacterium]|nr:hypothetical protein [Chlorobiota bacterium]
MNRVIAAFVLVLYLGTATELPQLAKLPVLIAHYIEHAAREHLSIADFLHEHYMQGDVYDADRSRDLQLPFKVDIAGAWQLAVAPCCIESVILTPPGHSLLSPCLYCASLLSGIAPRIWHPPATA